MEKHVLSKSKLLHYVMLACFMLVINTFNVSADTNNALEIQQAGKTVSGFVKDKAGEPLIGVSVAIKGTTTGDITDIDGKYSISADNNSTLVFSYIGYKTQDIKVGNQSTIDVILQEDNQILDEVVVVGYGTQKKANLTGAVASVNFEQQMASRPVTNVSTALAGLVSGMQVRQSSGKPGEDTANIKIRGTGSLSGSTSPLVIIDGMPGGLDTVNPNDIESMSVLKDAASSAIYGIQAANGVILITTKKGKSGKINVQYSGHFSIAKPAHLIKNVSNYADYMEWINESFTNVGQNIHFSQNTIDTWREKSKRPNDLNEIGVPNYVAYPNTDWQNVIFEKDIISEHNVSVRGGSDRIRFLMSAGYLNNPGIVQNTGIKKYSVRTNLDVTVTKWLTVGTNTFASQEDKDPGNFGNANNFLRQTTPGLYPEWNGKYGGPEASEESATANGILGFLNDTNGTYRKSRYNTTLYSKISPLEGLTWSTNFNYQRLIDERRYWTRSTDRVKFSTGEVLSVATPASQMSTSFYNYGNERYTLDNLLNYSITINQDHDFTALLGYSETYYKMYYNSASKKGLIDENIYVPSEALEMTSISGNIIDRSSRSIFGRINYAYKSKYLLESTFRRDGNSKYHKDHQWGTFPSVSAAWRISEESFMNGTKDFLDNLKLRLSWGTNGSAATDDDSTPNNYVYQSTYSGYNYSFGGNQVPALAASQIGNNVLQWEKSSTYNIGLDATFLKNRLTLEVDAYKRITSDLLVRAIMPLTMGIKTAPMTNVAEMQNSGIELALGWRDKIKDFEYSINANFSYNKNKVTKYKGSHQAGWVTNADGTKTWSTNIGEVSTGGINRIIEGKIKDEFYLRPTYSGSGAYFKSDGAVDPNGGPKDGMIRTEKDMEWVKAMIAAGNEFWPNKTVGKNKIWYGDYIYADVNGDGVYGSGNDDQFLNVSTDPKYDFGLQLAANWKGFDASVQLAGAAGFKLYWAPTSGYNSTATRVGVGLGQEIADNHYFYDPENPNDPRTNINAKYGRLTSGETGSQNAYGNTQLYLYKGDYLKIKNITLGYSLPKKIAQKIMTENVRVFFSGENLATFNSFPGQDPEQGASPSYVSMKQFAFGINVTF